MNIEKKKMNLAETLTYLEDLEVSDSSDSEPDINIKHRDSTKIYIQPPVDPNGDISDVDSASEEESSTDNLSPNQLLAHAALEVKQIEERWNCISRRITY